MRNDASGQPVFPIVRWDIGPLSEHDAIMVRAECLDVTTMATHQTQFMALTRAQVKDLLADISKALAKLDATQATPDGNKLQ